MQVTMYSQILGMLNVATVALANTEGGESKVDNAISALIEKNPQKAQEIEICGGLLKQAMANPHIKNADFREATKQALMEMLGVELANQIFH